MDVLEKAYKEWAKGPTYVYSCDSETSFLTKRDAELAENTDQSVARMARRRATLTGGLKIDYDLKTYTPSFSTFKELLNYLVDNTPDAPKGKHNVFMLYFYNLAYDFSYIAGEFSSELANVALGRKEFLTKLDEQAKKSTNPSAKAWLKKTKAQKLTALPSMYERYLEVHDNGQLADSFKMDVIKTGSRIISVRFIWRDCLWVIRDLQAIYPGGIAALGESLNKNPNIREMSKLVGDLDYKLIKNGAKDYNKKELGYFWRDIDILGQMLAIHLGWEPVNRYYYDGVTKKRVPYTTKASLKREYEGKKKEFNRMMDKIKSGKVKLTSSSLAISEVKRFLALDFEGRELKWVPSSFKVRNGELIVDTKIPSYMKPHRVDYKSDNMFKRAKYRYEQDLKTLEKNADNFIKSVRVRSDEELEDLMEGLFGKNLYDSVELYNFFKSGYFGGFSYVDYSIVAKPSKYGVVCDRNSMYPSVMLNKYWPDIRTRQEMDVKEAQDELDGYKKEFIKEIETGVDNGTFDKAFRFYGVTYKTFKLKSKTSLGFKGTPVLPKILNKLSGEPVFTDSLRQGFYDTNIDNDDDTLDNGLLYLTLRDLMHFIFNYHVDGLRIVKAYKMDSLPPNPFNFFVAYYGRRKVDGKLNNDPVMTLYAKLCLNGCYGKFGQRWDLDGVNVAFKNDVLTYEVESNTDGFNDKPVANVVIASTVTSLARDNLFKTIYSCHRSPVFKFVYADTDSVHLLFKKPGEGKTFFNKDTKTRQKEYSKMFSSIGIEYDKARLGAWKVEDEFIRAMYLRSKVYVEVHPKNDECVHKFVIKLAGVGTEGKRLIEKNISGGEHVTVDGKDKVINQKPPSEWDFSKFTYGNLRGLPVTVNIQGKGGMIIKDGFKDISPKPFDTTPYFTNGLFKEYIKVDATLEAVA